MRLLADNSVVVVTSSEWALTGQLLVAWREEAASRGPGAAASRSDSSPRNEGRRRARPASPRRSRRRAVRRSLPPTRDRAPGRARRPGRSAARTGRRSAAEEDRKHVPAEAAFRGRVEEVPDVVESEQGREQRSIPDEWVEGREECDRRRRLGRVLEQLNLVLEHVSLPANALDVDADECTALDQLRAQSRSTGMTRPLGGRLRRAETAEDVSAGAGAEQAVRAVARVASCAGAALRAGCRVRESPAGASRSSRS